MASVRVPENALALGSLLNSVDLILIPAFNIWNEVSEVGLTRHIQAPA